jgi:hypothetical protein
MHNNKEPGLQHNQTVKRLTFPEAVAVAYSARQIMGHDWRITNVKEDIKHTNLSDCSTPNTISIS